MTAFDDGVDDLADRVAGVLKEEAASGAACGWRPCTGCYESEDGYPLGDYPHSKTFGCLVGAGCSECGGLGVVWEYYSKADLDAMVRDLDPAAKFAEWVGEGPKLAKAAGVYVGITVYDKEPHHG